MTFSVLISALALMLIFEGIGPFFFPNRWRKFMLKIAQEQSTTIRQMGALLLGLGIILLIFIQ
ncbi:DUF2065 domain-containing protein [Thalassotalea aquiviva]|uniref:DUF2065 domain-containing protein n=1 Tax=Thalassotalea aquiviva TaxID=3242415 RepID=UPI00352A6CE3